MKFREGVPRFIKYFLLHVILSNKVIAMQTLALRLTQLTNERGLFCVVMVNGENEPSSLKEPSPCKIHCYTQGQYKSAPFPSNKCSMSTLKNIGADHGADWPKRSPVCLRSIALPSSFNYPDVCHSRLNLYFENWIWIVRTECEYIESVEFSIFSSKLINSISNDTIQIQFSNAMMQIKQYNFKWCDSNSVY